MEYKELVIQSKESNLETIVITKNQLIEIKNCDFCIRSGAELDSKAIYLPKQINDRPVKWIIALDSVGNLCAIPLLKED